MSSDYNYDAEGQFFPFFMLTVVSVFTIPLTYNVLKASEALEQTGQQIESDFKPKDADIIAAQRRKQKRKERKVKRIIAVVFGWAAMLYLGWLVYNAEQTRPRMWDPYEILGVSRVRTTLRHTDETDSE
jgi:translocation protein SEC63